MFCYSVAPHDDPEARAVNARERLALTRLAIGVRVIEVNADHAFASSHDAVVE